MHARDTFRGMVRRPATQGIKALDKLSKKGPPRDPTNHSPSISFRIPEPVQALLIGKITRAEQRRRKDAPALPNTSTFHRAIYVLGMLAQSHGWRPPPGDDLTAALEIGDTLVPLDVFDDPKPGPTKMRRPGVTKGRA
jgi:hypothetical protein